MVVVYCHHRIAHVFACGFRRWCGKCEGPLLLRVVVLSRPRRHIDPLCLFSHVVRINPVFQPRRPWSSPAKRLRYRRTTRGRIRTNEGGRWRRWEGRERRVCVCGGCCLVAASPSPPSRPLALSLADECEHTQPPSHSRERALYHSPSYHLRHVEEGRA